VGILQHRLEQVERRLDAAPQTDQLDSADDARSELTRAG
jgi:hypothetical protein